MVTPRTLILPPSQFCYRCLKNGCSRQKVWEPVQTLYHPIWLGSSFKGDGERQSREAGRFLPMSVLSGSISPRAQAIVWGLHTPSGMTTLWTSPTHLHLGEHRDLLPGLQCLLSCPTQINTHNRFSFLFSISDSFQRLWKQSFQSPKPQSQGIRVPPDLIPMKRKHTRL